VIFLFAAILSLTMAEPFFFRIVKSSLFVIVSSKIRKKQQKIGIFFCFVFGLIARDVSGSGLNDVVNLNIIIPGYIGFKSMASMSNVGPAVDTGISRLSTIYPFLNITKTYLLENTNDCDTMKSGVQNQLAKWYYRNYRESDVDVIITTGKFLKIWNFFLSALCTQACHAARFFVIN
jgi:hypothetical protein